MARPRGSTRNKGTGTIPCAIQYKTPSMKKWEVHREFPPNQDLFGHNDAVCVVASLFLGNQPYDSKVRVKRGKEIIWNGVRVDPKKLVVRVKGN